MLKTANGVDYAGNPDREGRVATVCGESYAWVNKDHLMNLVEHLFMTLGQCETHRLRLHVFQPPYRNQVQAPLGYMEFWLESELEPDMLFAVEFGDSLRNHAVFPEELTREVLQNDAEGCDPSMHATVANFDELWLFACRLAEKLKVAGLHMSYGI